MQHEARVIRSGVVKDRAHLEDIRKAAIRDGFVKAIVCQPISHYWELALPVIAFEDMPDMKGSALVLYLGSRESFNYFWRRLLSALEQAAATRSKFPVKMLAQYGKKAN